MLEQHDSRTRRCPLLGHDVAFSYCRVPGQDTPCRKIFDCWWDSFDVGQFMESHYDAETLKRVLAPPKSKTASLVDLIERARKRARG